jgi:hypothetical protein
MKLLWVWLLAMASLVEAYAGLGSERQEERCIVGLENVHAAHIDCAVLDAGAGFGDFDRPRHVWRYSAEAVVIGATPEHPFFSVDRQAYIAAGELHPGEEVMTAGEKVVKFLAGKLRDKGEPVYNIEVWREHNYYGFKAHVDHCLIAKYFIDKQTKALWLYNYKFMESKNYLASSWGSLFYTFNECNPNINYTAEEMQVWYLLMRNSMQNHFPCITD